MHAKFACSNDVSLVRNCSFISPLVQNGKIQYHVWNCDNMLSLKLKSPFCGRPPCQHPPLRQRRCASQNCAIWTIFPNSDKYNLQVGQIQFAISTNTFCGVLCPLCQHQAASLCSAVCVTLRVASLTSCKVALDKLRNTFNFTQVSAVFHDKYKKIQQENLLT